LGTKTTSFFSGVSLNIFSNTFLDSSQAISSDIFGKYSTSKVFLPVFNS
jgi:hypothetical protein